VASPIKWEWNRGGIRAAALNSDGVRAEVERIAQSAAQRARSMTDDEIEVEMAGRSRARAYIRRLGSGTVGEAKDRALGRSLGGGA